MKADTSRAPVSQRAHTVDVSKNGKGIGEKISVVINDQKFSVPFGKTILEACRENQIHVPTLCHHPDLCIA